jgi:predicted GH43/DUF377 family glycosyl hydrolase
MWYTRYTSSGTQVSIGLATSGDGLNWRNLNSSVLSSGRLGTWDSNAAYWASVLWNGSKFLMYYTGISPDNPAEIGLATSSDMVHWTRYSGNPILKPGPEAYDNFSVTFPTVLYEHGLYQIWYAGRVSGNHTNTINYAYSQDGLHWTKYDFNPVLTLREVQPGVPFGPSEPSVVDIGGVYLMAFEFLGNFNYATSENGTGWVPGLGHLLSGINNTSSQEWGIETPHLVVENSHVLMYYARVPYFNSSLSQPTTIGVANCSILAVVNTTQRQQLTTTSFVTQVQTTSLIATTTVYTTVSFPAYLVGFAVVIGAVMGTLLSIVTLRLMRRFRLCG